MGGKIYTEAEAIEYKRQRDAWDKKLELEHKEYMRKNMAEKRKRLLKEFHDLQDLQKKNPSRYYDRYYELKRILGL